MGIRFDYQGRDVKLLSYLRVVEADRIFRGMEKLGYRVQWDVAMPMMIEIDRERRGI